MKVSHQSGLSGERKTSSWRDPRRSRSLRHGTTFVKVCQTERASVLMLKRVQFTEHFSWWWDFTQFWQRKNQWIWSQVTGFSWKLQDHMLLSDLQLRSVPDTVRWRSQLKVDRASVHQRPSALTSDCLLSPVWWNVLKCLPAETQRNDIRNHWELFKNLRSFVCFLYVTSVKPHI